MCSYEQQNNSNKCKLAACTNRRQSSKTKLGRRVCSRKWKTRKLSPFLERKKNDSAIKQTQHVLHKIFISVSCVDVLVGLLSRLSLQLHQWCLRRPINLNKTLSCFQFLLFAYSFARFRFKLSGFSLLQSIDGWLDSVSKFFFFSSDLSTGCSFVYVVPHKRLSRAWNMLNSKLLALHWSRTHSLNTFQAPLELVI